MALDLGECICLHPWWLKTVCTAPRRGRSSVRPDTQLFPGPSVKKHSHCVFKHVSVWENWTDGWYRNSFKQTGDQSDARGGEPSGLLFPLFCNSKERGYSPLSNFGPCVLNKHVWKYSFKMLTHKVLCRSIRPNNWFVKINLSDAYFHIYIYPSHRKILRLHTEHNLRVSNYYIRANFSPKGFYQMCGSNPVPIKEQGNENIVLHRWLSDMLVVKRASSERCRDGVKSSQQLGVQDKHDKELFGALSTNRISKGSA